MQISDITVSRKRHGTARKLRNEKVVSSISAPGFEPGPLTPQSATLPPVLARHNYNYVYEMFLETKQVTLRVVSTISGLKAP